MIVGDVTGGRDLVRVADKIVEGFIVLEVPSGVGLYLVTSILEEGSLLDGTKGHNAAELIWDIIVGGLHAVKGADTAVSAFVAIVLADMLPLDSVA